MYICTYTHTHTHTHTYTHTHIHTHTHTYTHTHIHLNRYAYQRSYTITPGKDGPTMAHCSEAFDCKALNYDIKGKSSGTVKVCDGRAVAWACGCESGENAVLFVRKNQPQILLHSLNTCMRPSGTPGDGVLCRLPHSVCVRLA